MKVFAVGKSKRGRNRTRWIEGIREEAENRGGCHGMDEYDRENRFEAKIQD